MNKALQLSEVHRFMNAIKAVALKAETAVECFHLLDWYKATVNVVAVPREDDEMVNLWLHIQTQVNYWDANGLVEDELLPALSLLHTFAAHGWLNDSEFDTLVDRKHKCDYMIQNPDLSAEYDSYEAFCDKYAMELNYGVVA